MPNPLGAVCATLLCIVLACLGCQQTASDAVTSIEGVDPQLLVQRGGLRFVADCQVGLQLAHAQGSPCLLFFTAEWCTFCQQMEEMSFTDPAIQQLAEQFVCVLVDADLDREVCRQFAVRGYPTVQFLDAHGRKLHSLVGRQSPTQLELGMRAALQRLAWLDKGTTTQR